MEHKDQNEKCGILMIPVVVANGILSGILSGVISVITAYFFKPIWLKILSILDWKQDYWSKK